MRLRNFFDTGWYALDWDYTGPGPGSDGTNTYVYGPVTMLLLHAWSIAVGRRRLAGGLDLRARLSGASPRRGRHRPRRGRQRWPRWAGWCSGSWRWGLVAAAVLMAVPMWTGHMMFNVKDVPVATGHTLCTLGLLLFVRDAPASRPAPGRPARQSWSRGLVLTLGTRPGMWSGLTVLFAVAVVGVLWSPVEPGAGGWSPWPSWRPRAARRPRSWSRSTRTSSGHRCGRCRAPARPRRTS